MQFSKSAVVNAVDRAISALYENGADSAEIGFESHTPDKGVSRFVAKAAFSNGVLTVSVAAV
jgi:hypothetical protein